MTTTCSEVDGMTWQWRAKYFCCSHLLSHAKMVFISSSSITFVSNAFVVFAQVKSTISRCCTIRQYHTFKYFEPEKMILKLDFFPNGENYRAIPPSIRNLTIVNNIHSLKKFDVPTNLIHLSISNILLSSYPPSLETLHISMDWLDPFFYFRINKLPQTLTFNNIWYILWRSESASSFSYVPSFWINFQWKCELPSSQFNRSRFWWLFQSSC